jgi:hypothetical protein
MCQENEHIVCKDVSSTLLIMSANFLFDGKWFGVSLSFLRP